MEILKERKEVIKEDIEYIDSFYFIKELERF